MNEFSVCQFFDNGNYEYVRRYVSAEQALTAFRHYTSNVAVKIGIVERVIIHDEGARRLHRRERLEIEGRPGRRRRQAMNEIYEGMCIDDFDELCSAWNQHTEKEFFLDRREQRERVKQWLAKRFEEICKLRIG